LALPVILELIFLVLAPKLCVESPTWLLMKNRREEAKQVVARLYGEENMYTALSWMESSSNLDPKQGLEQQLEKTDSLFVPKYRMQLAAAILLSCSQQISGINAVFYYSGSRTPASQACVWAR
jgi:hypothetical protein